ncbi:hypothetical protein AB833_03170 [Chromatiales bacterium (ex Bugula neritina AB1)]|nr:hypothetical protein AB833_03170 [Chromatiales bacterium (ex Bugula neritina AB1)]
MHNSTHALTKPFIATAAAVLIAGTAAAQHDLPCSKAQLWITSLPTVPAATNAHQTDGNVNIANIVLDTRGPTILARKATANSKAQIAALISTTGQL